MESFEVLQKAIPELQSPKVAKFLGVVAGYVNAWRRRPSDDENETATGKRSPLDRICELIDVCFLINPGDTGLIVQHVVGHYRRLLKTHAKPIDCQVHIADTVDDLLTQAKEAAMNLNKEGCTAATLRELVQMRDAADSAIERVQKTMSQEDQTP